MATEETVASVDADGVTQVVELNEKIATEYETLKTVRERGGGYMYQIDQRPIARQWNGGPVRSTSRERERVVLLREWQPMH